MHGRPVAEEDAAPEGRRRAVPRHFLAGQRNRLLLDSELTSDSERTVEDPVLRGRRRDPQQPTLAEPHVLAEGAHGGDRPIRCASDRERSLGAEHIAEARQARPVAVEEAAVAATGPDPAARGLEHDHVQPGLPPLQLERRPEPGEAGADDGHVGLRVAVERGLLRVLGRLL